MLSSILFHLNLITSFQFFSKGILTYYVTNSTSNVQNRSCIIPNVQFASCITVNEITDKVSSLNGTGIIRNNISIIFLHEIYNINATSTLYLSGLSKIELKPLVQRKVILNCMGNFSITISGAQIVSLSSIIFHDCGKIQPVIYFNRTVKNTLKVELVNCSFLRSVSGFLYFQNQISRLQVFNCVFSESQEAYAIQIQSTKIQSASLVNFRNSTFSDNAAGSVKIHGVTRMTSKFFNCYLVNNTSPNYYLASAIDIENSEISISIDTSTFERNNGGPVINIHFSKGYLNYLLQGHISISNCNFSEHVLHSKVLTIQYYNTVIRKSNFNKNIGIGNNSYGGAICTNNSENVQIVDCNFIGNSGMFGSALYTVGGKISVTDSRFFINWVKMNGGALHVMSKTNIVNCVFIYNFGKFGGAVYSEHYYLNMTNCSFQNNIAHDGGAAHIAYGSIINSCNFTKNKAKRNGGALVVLGAAFGNTMLFIYNSNFINNSANISGGALIINVYSLDIINCSFRSNKARVEGGAIFVTDTTFYPTQVKVNISDSTLKNNSASIGGAISIAYLREKLAFKRINFHNNRGKEKGGAISITNSHQANASLENCTFFSNQVSDAEGKGGAIFAQNLHILSVGTTDKFVDNYASFGGAICLLLVQISFIVNCKFEKNIASYGGAISSSQKTVIFLFNASILQNKASLYGGGIYLKYSVLHIFNTTTFENNLVLQQGEGDAIYVDGKEQCKLNSCLLRWQKDAEIILISNLSNNSSLIFGGSIDRCNDSQLISTVSEEISVNGNPYNPDSGLITSSAIRFCFCSKFSIDCEKRELNGSLSSGQALNVSITCVDQMYQPKPCIVKSAYDDTNIELGQGQSLRHITSCEDLSFNAYFREQTSSTLTIKGEISCNEMMWDTLKIHVNTKPCPLGFQIIKYRCNCDKRLTSKLVDIECNVSTKLMTTSTSGWFSYHGGYLRVHKNCPLNYCISGRKIINLSDPDTQCRSNRSGVLCGRCATNYSVVLGSWNCRQCSHLSRYNFVWLTILIALAGVVLVAFLLLLKITVSSGTINGLLLYANLVSSSGLLDHPSCTLHPILRVFLSWINLDLGIEVCFYSGMDVYQKSWLQFLFPLYIWFLVGLIIFICHYSSTIMKLMGLRNIEVLATLFLISYSKLLKSIAASLHYTDILIGGAGNVSHNLTSQKLWLYDGNILWFSKQHLPMFTVSLIFLVFVFLPYTLLLLFEQCPKSLPRKRGLAFIQNPLFTLIIDPYHAPYTKHHRYWTGLGLLIRCCLFTIFATSDNVEMNMILIIAATALLLIIMVTSSIKIYRKKSVNLLELFYHINLLVLALLVAYGVRVCVAITFSASLSLFMFVIIIIYHIHITMLNNINCYKELIKSGKEALLINRSKLLTTKIDKDIKENTNSTSTTYFELRESLITN